MTTRKVINDCLSEKEHKVHVESLTGQVIRVDDDIQAIVTDLKCPVNENKFHLSLLDIEKQKSPKWFEKTSSLVLAGAGRRKSLTELDEKNVKRKLLSNIQSLKRCSFSTRSNKRFVLIHSPVKDSSSEEFVFSLGSESDSDSACNISLSLKNNRKVRKPIEHLEEQDVQFNYPIKLNKSKTKVQVTEKQIFRNKSAKMPLTNVEKNVFDSTKNTGNQKVKTEPLLVPNLTKEVCLNVAQDLQPKTGEAEAQRVEKRLYFDIFKKMQNLQEKKELERKADSAISSTLNKTVGVNAKGPTKVINLDAIVVEETPVLSSEGILSGKAIQNSPQTQNGLVEELTVTNIINMNVSEELNEPVITINGLDTDAKKDDIKYQNSIKREMSKLHCTFKKMPTLQDWNPNVLHMSKRITRQMRNLNKPQPKKQALTITPKHGNSKLTEFSKSVQIGKVPKKRPFKISTANSKVKAKNIEALNELQPPILRVKKPLNNKPNTYSRISNAKNLEVALKKKTDKTIYAPLKELTDSKQEFKAIRYDFINKSSSANSSSSSSSSHSTKNKMLQTLKVQLEHISMDNIVSTNINKTCSLETINQLEEPSEMGNDGRHNFRNDHMLEAPEKDSALKVVAQRPKKRRLDDDDTLRSSIRQTECAFRYKEITVKKHLNFIQIVLVLNNHQKSLTIEALTELKESLVIADKDPTCKSVLINGTGQVFCTGLDLNLIVGTGKSKITDKLMQSIKEFIECLAFFPKPVIAAVNGLAVGLGVTLLTFCDVVFASDKATFYMPYANLGCIPEAAATLMLPQVVGSVMSSNMLLSGQKLTAQQALTCGLVSEIIWPTKLLEEIIPKVENIALQSLEGMKCTKMMLRSHQMERLSLTLDNETKILPKQWLSPTCQKSIRNVINNGGFLD